MVAGVSGNGSGAGEQHSSAQEGSDWSEDLQGADGAEEPRQAAQLGMN